MLSYSGWAIIAALTYSFVLYPSVSIYLSRRKWTRLLSFLSPICVACSAYLVYAGLLLVIDWSNPFAGKGAEVARAVHNPKGWLVIAAVVVWPYLLMCIGILTGGAALREWFRTLRISN